MHLAVRVGIAQDVLAFIEENKAHLLTRQMHSHMTSTSSVSVELQAQLGQIRWLQEKLRTTSPSQFRWQPHPFRQQLKELVEAYTDARNRWQRVQTDEPEELLGISFDQDRFRQKATLVLGQEWVGVGLLFDRPTVTGGGHNANQQLHLGEKNNREGGTGIVGYDAVWLGSGRGRSQSPLEVLGQFLFPEAVTHQLTTTTTLIIAPHRQLHFVPWSALWVRNKPLMALCVPTLALSLTNLMTLWSWLVLLPFTSHHGLAPGSLQLPHQQGPLPESSRGMCRSAAAPGHKGSRFV